MDPVTPVFPGGAELPVTEFAKDQEQYRTLPCWKHADGTVVIRWRLSWKERFQIFLSGNLWQTVLTFNAPLQPIKLETSRPQIDVACRVGWLERIKS